ncbi:MAG: tripartite tricarboxylate transporter permease [Candidatus Azotimanducaceae bacterium WSBS_2022_MAG_OTU7]
MTASASVFDNLIAGFSIAATPENLLFGIGGVMLGTAVGVLPGLGPAVAISLLLPLTFGLDPVSAFIMFGGIYYGAMYGGAITAILVNTPGDSSATVTTFDGHPLAKQGRAGTALMAAIIGSFIGGTFATIMLMLVAPGLVEIALKFGPPEYFALMLLALVIVSTVGSSTLAKALFATMLGIGIGMVGIDLQTGEARMTFGIPELYSGVNVVLAAIGLFAVGQAFWVASGGLEDDKKHFSEGGKKMRMTRPEWVRSGFAWVRGTVIGFFVGILPGSGGTLASFLSYGVEKRFSKHPEKFGTGVVEGVAAPEASNNAAAGGSMVPLLALGIPGSATTAVMLVAFQMYGLQPGPLLFENSGDLVWALIASLYITNVLLVVLNLPLVGLWAKLLELPPALIYSSVLVFSTLGAYTVKGSIGDVAIVFVLGLVAVMLRRFQFPVAPVLLGILLGPLIEQEFRRSLSISGGDYSILYSSPLAATFLAVSIISVIGSVVSNLRAKRKLRLAQTTAADIAD